MEARIRATAQGLAYLRSQQRADGGFDSFSGSHQRPFTAEFTYNSTFGPAIILHALAGIAEAAHIREPLAAWLLAQKSPNWSFNYWAADAPERTERPYPDDLDDTFCALAALYRHDAKLVGADALGTVVRLLLATESQVGGPYRTWLVPPEADGHWKDVDVAVNCNVAYFLQMVAHELPNLSSYIEQVITERRLSSPYYPNIFPLWYYATRAYHGTAAAQLRTHMLQRRGGGHWGTPLRTALAVSALRQVAGGEPYDEAIGYLLRTQQPDGSWPAEAFCIDPARDGKKYYGGSPALTTALVLEALHAGMPADPPAAAASAAQNDHAAAELHTSIVARALTECRGLPGDALQQTLASSVERMVRGVHGRDIVLWPLAASRSLAGPPTPSNTLTRLGLANLYGWTAYTIYDDILDGDGDNRLLPAANTAMRLAERSFLAAVRTGAYHDFVRRAFQRVDAANAWEAAQCRFTISAGSITVSHIPNYGRGQQLAERSFGHLLAPVAVLAARGILPDDHRTKHLLDGMQHYLIARQLGDDLRDWQEDLRAGTCTFVVAELLRTAKVAPAAYKLNELLPRLQHAYGEQILPELSRAIMRHTAAAERACMHSGLLLPDAPLLAPIQAIAELARRQLEEHADAQSFLRAYRGK
jgi:hypothetical protein